MPSQGSPVPPPPPNRGSGVQPVVQQILGEKESLCSLTTATDASAFPIDDSDGRALHHHTLKVQESIWSAFHFPLGLATWRRSNI